MAICPTPGCGEKLATHSRRKFCAKCRARMGWWALHKSRGDIVAYSKRLTRGLFRVAHIGERKEDQLEAVSQLRRSKRGSK